MSAKSLDAILEEFDASGPGRQPGERGTTLCFWVTTEEKARFAEMQKRTRGAFGKKLKAVFRAVLDKDEARAG